VLKHARDQSGRTRDVLNLYTEALLLQTSQTAACNRLHLVEERLARWLLSVQDRARRESFTLTQEFVAQMLGVHRPTVTTALRRFQRDGLIRTRGREVTVLDRVRLGAVSCECYDILRRAFDRLLKTGVGEPGEAHAAPARFPNGPLHRKDEVVAAICNEFYAPLASIIGWSRSLAAAVPADSRRGLQIIERSARAQIRLVEDLLDTVRLADAALTISRSDARLSVIVEEAIETVYPLATEGRVHLSARVNLSLATAWLDADRVRQALVSILALALRVSGEGGTVDVLVDSSETEVRLGIAATRAGVPDRRASMDGWRPATRKLDQADGAPLILKRLIEMHGGRLRVDVAQDSTIWTVELPAIRSDGAPTQGPAAEH